MSAPEPLEARVNRIETALARLAGLTVELGEAQVRNTADVAELAQAQARNTDAIAELAQAQARTTADIAELSTDIRRLFDGMSDHLRDHPT